MVVAIWFAKHGSPLTTCFLLYVVRVPSDSDETVQPGLQIDRNIDFFMGRYRIR